jgi:glycosyltransferase involved in cell wall biosynthesis
MERRMLQISVVIASIVGAPFIDDCLASIEKDAKELGAEVIVVACGTEDYARRIEGKFPWVRVVHPSHRETVPELRAIGVEQAKGDIVAIIEEHCLAGSGWLHNVMKGLENPAYVAVGGPVVDHAYERLQDWVVYFCEYNGYLPPWTDGESHDLNGANIAYRRQVLLDHKDRLKQGYWEVALHPLLLKEGQKLRALSTMVVYHRGPFPFGYYLRQRYWFSRAFAGARTKALPASRRLAYLVASPLVPIILLARMATRVWQKHCHVDKFALSLPLLIPALAVYAAGEWVGYVAGAGDALSKVE